MRLCTDAGKGQWGVRGGAGRGRRTGYRYMTLQLTAALALHGTPMRAPVAHPGATAIETNRVLTRFNWLSSSVPLASYPNVPFPVPLPTPVPIPTPPNPHTCLGIP